MATEHVVAKVGELKNWQMKQVEIGGRKILLVCADGEHRAFSGACPHHGAELAGGLLHEGQIRCPWHQAVFDAESGDVVQPPAMDSLVQFDVKIDGQNVLVVLPDELAESVAPPMAMLDTEADNRTFIILGAGAAGMVAAETLRREGYQGRIYMLTREKHLPYDRTDLSKPYLRKADAKRPSIRSSAFYDKHGIEVLTECEVVEVDVKARTITCADGESIAYDRLLLASGSAARKLGVVGEELDNVLTLRSLDDCDRLRSRLGGGGAAVVIGASFIGMEVAAAMVERGLDTTVVAPESVPFESVFGERIGRMYRQVQEEEGVKFLLGRKVKGFAGDGAVRTVELDDGRVLPAGLVVVGVGARPVTSYLKGVAVNDDGSVTVDDHLRVAPDVWAAGDIARFPDWRTGEPIRIEHWRLAQQQGQVAGRNMAGKDTRCDGVPFFWTNMHWVITAYIGQARKYDEIVFDGKPEDRDFLAYYVKGGKVWAVAGCGRERAMCRAAEVMRETPLPTVEQIRDAVESLQPRKA